MSKKSGTKVIEVAKELLNIRSPSGIDASPSPLDPAREQIDLRDMSAKAVYSKIKETVSFRRPEKLEFLVDTRVFDQVQTYGQDSLTFTVSHKLDQDYYTVRVV